MQAELRACGVNKIGCLHITSWDADHCAEVDLEETLAKLNPAKIEYPGYPPHTETAEKCLGRILSFKERNPACVVQRVDPPYIKSLEPAESWGYHDIFYHPKYLSEDSNNNSTVKLFRTGCFNIASLGDVEDVGISSYLRNHRAFREEVDIMILAHHGADNGFTTSAFLRSVQPSVAIASSNYDSQFEHPKPEIRELLHKYQIPLYTTKTGDVVIVSVPPHTRRYKIVNLMADSEELSSTTELVTKKSEKLGHNLDTVRNIFTGRRPPFTSFGL
ncbi:MAG: hypothetical protein Q8R91_05240 [Candidatus Omnitrophota bacterium]|nr:hypothetical protein [Candidatus Omnitrophota bacterium]